jgi:hypothetical protein
VEVIKEVEVVKEVTRQIDETVKGNGYTITVKVE